MSPTIDIPLETVACNCCGSPEADPLWVGRDRLHHLRGEFRYVRCRVCGLVYMNPRPNREAIREVYPPDYRPHRANPSRSGRRTVWTYLHDRTWREPINRLYAAVPNGGALLEVGCGSGAFLAEAQQRGWAVSGIDSSERAVNNARGRGLDVVCGTLETIRLEETFDRIRLSFVLEHVHDPLTTLRRVRSLLKPQGFAHLSIPNIDSVVARWFNVYWYDLDAPRHLYLFSPRTFEQLCRRARLDLVSAIGEINTSVFWSSLAFWLAARGVSDRMNQALAIENIALKWGSRLSLPATFAVGWILSKRLQTSRLHYIVKSDRLPKSS